MSISFINYKVSLETTQKQLKTQALPLSLDNIYTEIQKHIIQPYLISSMMANDIFVKSWLLEGEENTEKITSYLNTIKTKYSMFSTFLLSQKSKKYYSNKGLLEVIDETKPSNAWYYNFIKTNNEHEINLDMNKNLTNSLMMFINYRIHDEYNNLLGATGVGLKISYINDMLKRFREDFSLKVRFFDSNANLILSEDANFKKMSEIKSLASYQNRILSSDDEMFEATYLGDVYIIKTRYVPELNLFLVVEAKVDDFVKEIKSIFYINLLVSLAITFAIAYIILAIIRKYNSKMKFLADNDPLTKLANRRSFNEQFVHFFDLRKRDKKPLCVLFLDLDNFKNINDTYGHDVGDKVLSRTAKLLKSNIRKTDLIARWGGEEFVVLFIDSNLKETELICEKIRVSLEEDKVLKEECQLTVTGSFGLTQIQNLDTIDDVLTRADKAMYEAKSLGKNRVVKV